MKVPALYERRSAEVQLEQARLAFISARTTYQRLKALKKLEDLRAAKPSSPLPRGS
jgi:hypothetical protein